ncbi:MAG: hypothetical protein IPM23_04265 [Candidatus Melainabacteria bacterium]|nr:hypothetical protein [Candidatus Melainabacteria bacterium]
MLSCQASRPGRFMTVDHQSKNCSSALTAFGLAVLVMAGCLFAPPHQDTSESKGSIIDKHALLEQARSPKIILVGGSGIAYGLDSQRLANHYGCDVVNMGLTMYFGLRYMMEEVKSSIKPGDLVVLVPEYEHFFGMLNGNDYLVRLALFYPEALPSVSRVYASSPAMFCRAFRDLHRVSNLKWKERASRLDEQFFGRRAKQPAVLRRDYDGTGAYTGHLDKKAPGIEGQSLFFVESDFDPEAVAAVNEFEAFVRQRGASLVMVPPAIPASSYQPRRANFGNLLARLRSDLKLPILADSGRYAFADQSFFDSCYHLCREPREKRTDLFMEDLSRYIRSNRRLASFQAAEKGL